MQSYASIRMGETVSGRLPDDVIAALDELGKAAELSGVPLGAFMDALRRAGLLRDYDASDVQDDLAWATRT